MTFKEPQKQNEKTLQNEDIEQFNPKTQINEQKPTKQNCLNSIVEEIVDQIADKVTTKYDTLQTQDTETQAHNTSQINNQLTVQTQTVQVEQVQNKNQAEPKLQPKDDIVLQIKENDSEPETEVLRRNKLVKAPKYSASTENYNLLSTKNQLNSLDQNIQKEPKQDETNKENKQNEPKTVQFKPVQNEPAQQPPENSNKWFYVDLSGQIQGPFSSKQMDKWNKSGKLPENLLVSCGGFSHKLQNIDLLRENFFSDKTHTKKTGQIKIQMKGENINVEDILQNAQQIQIEVGTHTKQNVTKKSTLQTSHTEQIPKNRNIPKETKDVENPETENNISGKPKTNKTNLFGDDFYDYDLTYEPVKRNQPQQNHQAHENNNTGDTSNTQASAQSYSTQYDQQQQTQQQVNASEKQQYYEQNNESIHYRPFDESTNEDAIPEQEQKLEKPEQITNSPTESKNWSENQWAVFKTVVFEAILNYFEIEFETLEEALVYYRKAIVGADDGKATKIHLNFKQMASDSNISEKECNQKFQTLLGKELLSWPDNTVTAVKTKILELWQQEHEPDIAKRKKLIKAKIEQEFSLKQQVQYSYKEIQNKIDHILRKLQ
ncbi:GYF_domain [Hexamita inflata]|uniref:GYF domain n=1 Tax=Hexamita inflata TaxID=28002 RepID=A0AA86N7B9_9EUKA|nr:GYF domain [Hexamita inflata]